MKSLKNQDQAVVAANVPAEKKSNKTAKLEAVNAKTAEKTAKTKKAEKQPKPEYVRQDAVIGQKVTFNGAPNSPHFAGQKVHGVVIGTFFHKPDLDAKSENPRQYYRVKVTDPVEVNVIVRDVNCKLGALPKAAKTAKTAE